MTTIPKAPAGYSNCQTRSGAPAGSYMNHLVAVGERGGTPGMTVCGLTRFDSEPGADDADLPGWSMGGGGISGIGVEQMVCAACWSGAQA